ncbi:tissue factor-like, partial [Eucyclogobius newberryi]|uniref:tissue factor-like n=1 Tax=Eucyclogobius newberryi TaxID=166745 RepID=UPI003B59FF5E
LLLLLRTFTADVQTEGSMNNDYDLEELPHTYSDPFNPYKHSELSAVAFSIQKVAERSVTLNISDPLTGIHGPTKQLSIRDVLKKDLKYKVSYYKAGSTGKRDLIVDSNMAQIPNLDPGQSYCFMVAAFVPGRSKSVQQGAWSPQTCTSGSSILEELDMRTVFQAVFIPLVLLIVLVTVLVIYCRFCRRKHKTPDSPSQGPAAHCTVV